MKARTIALTLALCAVGVAAGFAAAEPNIGTWKLNEAKSKIAAGAPKNNTVVIEVAGDNVKVTVDGVDGAGKPMHNEWTGKFDGKYYDLSGSPTADKRAYTRVNNRTLSFREQKAGKVVLTGTITVARNGKSRTVSTNGRDAKGKWVHNTSVFDKQ